MNPRRNLRSISTPIILGAVSVPLSVALLVGWTLLIATRLSKAADTTLDVWLLVAGAISFLVILVVLVLLSFYLAREILEVRRQNSFIDSVTHELKSPLASIRLCLETLGRNDLPDDKREHLRVMMLEDVGRLSAFIDDVLQASRLTSFEVAGLTISPVILKELVSSIAAQVQSRYPENSDVHIDIDDDFVIHTDESAISVVLRNLLDNGLKYGGDDPRVVCRAESDGNQVIIEVTDSGIGIEPAHRKRVFHRFFRVPSTQVRERRGTGLGLFVASSLVRGLGGTLVAESEGLGRGTTMRLVLTQAAFDEA